MIERAVVKKKHSVLVRESSFHHDELPSSPDAAGSVATTWRNTVRTIDVNAIFDEAAHGLIWISIM